jgi:type IV fimbrial biogenesis protein FimT
VEEVGDRPVSRDLILRQRGFTIIEILLVIVIIGVLLSIAAPSFVTFTSSQKVKTASFDLYAAMMFARSEAIKRKVNVTVKPIDDVDWKNGWTIDAAGAATPLRRQDPLSGVTFSGATSVVYRLDGRLTGATVKVLIQPEIPNDTIDYRCIQVDMTGLPKTTNIRPPYTSPPCP